MRRLRTFHLALCFLLVGCAPTLSWIPDPLPIPSCQPDRILNWNDFLPHHPQDQRGAETAIRFLHHPSQHRLSIVFDHEHSWVRPNLIDPGNVPLWRTSEQLLAHEQLHFFISCIVVRQANLAITEQDNLWNMLKLTKSVAQRLNLQYDADTNHGLNIHAQHAWEREVMRQFKELGVKNFPHTASEETALKIF